MRSGVQNPGGGTPGNCDECRYSAYKEASGVKVDRHNGVSKRGWSNVAHQFFNSGSFARSMSRARRSGCAKVARPIRRGAALLEVILSLSLLLVAMVAVGVVFRNGQYFVEKAELRTRAMLLTEKIITVLDTGMDEDRDGEMDIDITEREQFGYFVVDGADVGIPGMSWMTEIEPSRTVEGLYEIDINIFLGDPEDEETRRNILRTRIVRAEPRGFDFERDLGLDEDQIEELTNALPDGVGPLLDPTNFDPRMLAQLPADQLIELLPTLMQAFGSQLGAGQVDQLMNMVNSGNAQNVVNQATGGASGGQSPLTPVVSQPGQKRDQ